MSPLKFNTQLNELLNSVPVDRQNQIRSSINSYIKSNKSKLPIGVVRSSAIDFVIKQVLHISEFESKLEPRVKKWANYLVEQIPFVTTEAELCNRNFVLALSNATQKLENEYDGELELIDQLIANLISSWPFYSSQTLHDELFNSGFIDELLQRVFNSWLAIPNRSYTTMRNFRFTACNLVNTEISHELLTREYPYYGAILEAHKIAGIEFQFDYSYSRVAQSGVKFDVGITIEALKERDGGYCQICGIEDCSQLAVFQIGHIQAMSKGGQHTWDNVQVECSRCNFAKGVRNPPPEILAQIALKNRARYIQTAQNSNDIIKFREQTDIIQIDEETPPSILGECSAAMNIEKPNLEITGAKISPNKTYNKPNKMILQIIVYVFLVLSAIAGVISVVGLIGRELR